MSTRRQWRSVGRQTAPGGLLLSLPPTRLGALSPAERITGMDRIRTTMNRIRSRRRWDGGGGGGLMRPAFNDMRLVAWLDIAIAG